MKKHAVYWFVRFCCWCGITALFYFLNSKRKRIVTFHHVIPDNLYFSGVVNGVSCRESDFKRILEQLGRRYRFSLDLMDTDSVTLTFDDGYRSQYEIVARCLMESGNIPAYLFVSGALVPVSEMRQGPLVIDLLTLWISCVPEGVYNFEFNGKRYRMDIVAESRLRIWCDVLWPLYCADATRRGATLLEALAGQCYEIRKIVGRLPEAYYALRFTGMTAEELHLLKSRGWAIGCHGYHHFPMGSLSEKEVRAEVADGMTALRDWRTTTVYSYPYGGMDTIGNDAPAVVRAFGAECAMSNILNPGLSGDPYRMPRMALSADRYVFHFELSGLKYFLKHRRLLPRVAVR